MQFLHDRLPSFFLLLASLGLLSACSAPAPHTDYKPVSRKTSRQMEHYSRVYGAAPALGEPTPESQYTPKPVQEAFSPSVR